MVQALHQHSQLNTVPLYSPIFWRVGFQIGELNHYTQVGIWRGRSLGPFQVYFAHDHVGPRSVWGERG